MSDAPKISPEQDRYIRSTFAAVSELAESVREALGRLPHKDAQQPLRNLQELLNTICDPLLGQEAWCEYCEEPIFGVDLDNGAGMAGDDGLWLCAPCMKAAQEEYEEAVKNGTLRETFFPDGESA